MWRGYGGMIMIQMGHILVLSQPDFIERQVRSVFSWPFFKRSKIS